MTDTSALRVAVLGLGIMGSAFARNAARAGLLVTGWDRSAERAAALAGAGVRAASTTVEAVREADAVVTMVADADAVFSVMEPSVLGAMKPGSAWLQMATIGVEGTERAIRLAATRPDVAFVDAPVSGSKYVAEAAKVIVLASGERERAGPAAERFFAAVAGDVHWLGPAGQGTRIGLLFSAWVGILIEDVAEVSTLAHELGIDPQRFIDIVAGGPLVPAWALEKFQKIAANRTAETEASVRLVDKNVRLALAAAGPARSRLPLLALAAATWVDAVRDFGDADVSAIYLALQRR